MEDGALTLCLVLAADALAVTFAVSLARVLALVLLPARHRPYADGTTSGNA